jgi:hypothetical protein
MDNNIGVGLIVGLTFASSIYVWSNEKFSSVQKTILLICIVFPPAQWIGILVILAYNNYKVNNSIEKVQERKVEQVKVNLDNSISNLADLKDKGILTDEEYKNKVAKINAEKEEQSLKNSLEYKQLKSLLDSGILTKEEFDSKVKLIQNVSEKEVDIEEINNVINSVNTTYLDNTEEKQQAKKGSSTPIYVFSILFFVILLGSVIIYSENNNNETNVDSTYVEPMVVDTLNTNVNSYQEPLKTKKFAYVVIEISKPTLDGYKPIDNKNWCYIVNKNENTYSDIIELDTYNDDIKYKLMDEAEKNLFKNYSYLSQNLYTNAVVTYGYEAAEAIQGQDCSITILKRDVKVFDSYSEASISKKDDSNIINTK